MYLNLVPIIVLLANSLKKMKTNNPTSYIHPNLIGKLTPGDNHSVWLVSDMEPQAYKRLRMGTETDILLIEDVISCLIKAYYQAKEGRKLLLIEDGFIGRGTTGKITSHLSCALDDRNLVLRNNGLSNED